MEALTLVLVPVLALVAPILVALISRVLVVPLVVFEIVLGIVFGPSVLGWAVPTDFSKLLSEIGLAMLFFVAGSEIDIRAIRGRPLVTASMGWVVSLAAALALGVAVSILVSGSATAGVFAAIALSSTALGTLLPVLRDAGELDTGLGRAALAVGTVGEFGPLIAISLFLGVRSPGPEALVMVAFIVLAGVAVWIAARADHSRAHALVAATLHSPGQFAIRLVLAILAALVGLSMALGLDILLGAFVAGVLWRIFVARAPQADREAMESKIEAVAFGFLVPIFFISTGMEFDLHALIAEPAYLIAVVAILGIMVLVRGLPGLLSLPPRSSAADRRSMVLLSATGLPIIVAVIGIALENKVLPPGLGAAFIAAGMLSVLLFPMLALLRRRNVPGGEAVAVVRENV